MDVILTGSTDRMLCREGFGKFHEFAEYMAGGPVWARAGAGTTGVVALRHGRS